MKTIVLFGGLFAALYGIGAAMAAVIEWTWRGIEQVWSGL